MKKAAPGIVTLLLVSGAAFAQPKPPAPAAPSGAPAAAPAAATPTTTPEPTLPDIADPMLEPPPPPQHVLSSWRDALSMVKSSSTSLRSALARIDQATARADQTGAGALPTVEASAFIERDILRGREPIFAPGGVPTGRTRQTPDPATVGGARLRGSVPIFAPRTWYDRKTSRQSIDVAALDVHEVKRQVVAAVADAIVTVVTNERLAEVSRVALKSTLSTVDLNRRRAALGASSTLDVLRTEEDVQLARAQVVAADERLMRSREALGFTLGSTDSWGVTPEIRLDALASDARSSCRTGTDVATRPDVKAARAKVELAERSAGAVDWSYWPRAEAYSELDFIPLERASPNGKHFTWNIGANLSWLIYDGGLRGGQKDEAAANVRVAQETATETQRQAQLEVNQTLRGVKVAEANLAVSARTREITTEKARLSKVAYMNGSGTSFDLVDAARRQRDTELDFAVKEFDVVRARIAALLALASCNL